MEKITGFLFAVILVLSSAVVFADVAQNNAQDQNTQGPNAPNMPTIPNMPAPPTDASTAPALPKEMAMPSPMPGMRTVVATSDGGIVIVEGNKVTKLDSNLEVTKSVELSDVQKTGGG